MKVLLVKHRFEESMQEIVKHTEQEACVFHSSDKIGSSLWYLHKCVFMWTQITYASPTGTVLRIIAD